MAYGLSRLLCAVVVMVAALTSASRAEIGSYLLFDMSDGTIIAQHRPTALWYPASITKLMTAYVTFDAVKDGRLKMTSPVKISVQARQQPPSKMGFPVGTVITVEAALRIILTKSANDVSVALAQAVGGTLTGFMDRMNAAADEIGMVDSHYDNPHGLPNTKQVTTARDVALLMMALQRDFPEFRDYFEMGGVQLGNRYLRNHNNLIRRFPGADGMKTGFICASGFNVAASATREGTRLGAVVLGGLTSAERDQRTAELLTKGFEALKTGGIVALDGFQPNVSEGERVGPVFAASADVPDPRLAVAQVTGERPQFGTVAALPPTTDTVAENRVSTVCTRPRPATRYSGGVAASRTAFEAQREAMRAWHRARTQRAQQREAALAAPLSAPGLQRRVTRPSAELPAPIVDPSDDAAANAAFIAASLSTNAPEALSDALPGSPSAATAAVETGAQPRASSVSQAAAAAPSRRRTEATAQTGEAAQAQDGADGVTAAALSAPVATQEPAASEGEAGGESGATGVAASSHDSEPSTVETGPAPHTASEVQTHDTSREPRSAAAGEVPDPEAKVRVASDPSRAFADDTLRPSAWSSAARTRMPPRRPGPGAASPALTASAAPAATAPRAGWRRSARSDLAPTAWSPTPLSAPWRNPLSEVPEAREPAGPRPLALPLGYLGPVRSAPSVAIRLGGADDARPDPKSGPVVGGGPPPRPQTKPTPVLATQPIDPNSVLSHAAGVRDTVAEPAQTDAEGS